ncbi:sulfite reductase flavoprotein subunit alpha [Venatoribacter cucullus]|uniref:NADPH--hemoprotein reductase n=1 Tax=Venatoribacter cucullus TaxID=2661630 RepID=A0A9X7UYB1_9GAMM|nr:flavodoxin domain-containing protein [Venatoribacter cucullus]QQD24340.1 sulfite reductase flavoprotein subunit alpha [Venatoribacter cucullus]
MLSAVPYLQASIILLAWLAFTFWCYRQPIKRWWQGTAATCTTLVAYASESGTAAALANQLQQQLQQQGKSSACLPLNQLQPQQLQQCRQLFIVASTYGDGEAPDNGRLFLPRLRQTQPLTQLRYAVLALGDRQYSQFCAFGMQLHQQLQQAGAQPLFDAITVHQQDPQALQHWQQQLHKQGIISQPGSSAAATPENEPINCSLLQRHWLNPGSPGAPVYQIDLQPQQPLQWQAGDIARLHINNQTRDYTIASLPAEGCLRLLVREHHHPSGQTGLGSGWLCHGLEAGQASHISLRSNPSFHAPEAERPLILIGNGTGLAGLRAHLQQRQQQGSSHNWLIYGERSPLHDGHWQQELQLWHHSGHLQQLDLAFSRHCADQPWPLLSGQLHHGYVQKVLQTQARELHHWVEQGAAIYLCGSRAGMATDVEQALSDILGPTRLQQLIEQGRFRRDVY